VSVDKSSSDTFRGLLRQVAPKTAAVVEEEMEALEATARANWPVKTGQSRDSMDLLTRARKGSVVTSLVVAAPYAYYVKSKKLGKNAAKALVLDPATNLADRLARRIAEALAKP
jgi:hypothetical protein